VAVEEAPQWKPPPAEGGPQWKPAAVEEAPQWKPAAVEEAPRWRLGPGVRQGGPLSAQEGAQEEHQSAPEPAVVAEELRLVLELVALEVPRWEPARGAAEAPPSVPEPGAALEAPPKERVPETREVPQLGG